MSNSMSSTRGERSRGRIYDKGERRYKHVGRTPNPEFRFENHHPRHWVGLCPNTIGPEECTQLLLEAIADENGDRELDFPKRLHVVHEGAIYRAETTDWGKSYHGYPYRGKMGRTLLAELRQMADQKGCLSQFENWVDEYIEIHGK
jgi:hypothetical protein